MRRYVKKWLSDSLKKAWLRLPKYAASVLKMIKKWFSAEYYNDLQRAAYLQHRRMKLHKIIEDRVQLISSRKELICYEWCTEGCSSLIFSNGSNGQWYRFIKQGTIDSNTIWIFLSMLGKTLF